MSRRLVHHAQGLVGQLEQANDGTVDSTYATSWLQMILPKIRKQVKRVGRLLR